MGIRTEISGLLRPHFTIAALLAGLAWQALRGQDGAVPVRIGVVAAHSQAELSRNYEPFTRYLAGKVPNHSFHIVRLERPAEALRAFERREVEFLNCSPSVFVELELRHGARALVTLEVNAEPGVATPWMAGAAFCLRERGDIFSLHDLRGKRVMALDPHALGGWLSLLRELKDLGIEPERDLRQVRYGGFYHRVLQAVLEGEADVGVLSASALRMAVLDLKAADRIRVIPPPRPIESSFPLPASTRLYPESAIVAAPHVPAKLADQVAVALLSLPPGSDAQRAAQAAGYTLPLNYQTVHECLKELRFGPYADYGKVTVGGAIRQHWALVFSVLIGVVALLSLSVAAVLLLNRKLRRSERRLARRAQLLAQASDAIIGLDLANRVIAWNAAAEKLLGWQAAETAGRPITELVPDFPAARVAGKGKWSVEAELTSRSGGRVITEVAFSPLRDERGQVIGSIADIRDVTEVRRLAEQFRQAQKLESIGRLAGGIAHDFNNLLTVINGYSDLLLARLEADHPQRRAAAEISKAGQRAARLVQQLLAIGRKQNLKLEVLDLNAAISEDLTLLERLMGEQIKLETSFHTPGPLVRADRVQLQQVLLNLAVNARDAMPGGGRIRVETGEAVFGAGDQLPTEDLPPGRYAVLSVADTGVGMDAVTRERLFEPFFTTKPPGKGSGLGLSTVFGIVKQCGGHIAVESQPGRGSEFRIWLPLAGDAGAAPSAGRALMNAVRK